MGPGQSEIGPSLWIPMPGPDRIKRFISSLALTELPDPARFLQIRRRPGPHRNFCTGVSLQHLIKKL